jgi:uncharacterized Zn finger protein (UPF0148 family)
MSSEANNKQRIVSSADLLRKGASLLGEACPRCGGVQVKFKGNVYCLNEDDLSELLSRGTTQNNQTGTPISNVADSGHKLHSVSTKMEVKKSSSSEQVRSILEEKLKKLSKQLDESNDIEEQTKLLELISKYVDTLNKL